MYIWPPFQLSLLTVTVVSKKVTATPNNQKSGKDSVASIDTAGTSASSVDIDFDYDDSESITGLLLPSHGNALSTALCLY